MPGIGIIANPHSKMNKRDPYRQKLLGYIVGKRGKLEITSSISDLIRVAKDFRENEVEIIAINGGDGTVSRTLTAIIKEYGETNIPPIALLRGGTMNVVASYLNLKGLPEQILYRLIEKHSSGANLEKRKLRAIRVDNEQYGFLFANGTAPKFLNEFYQNKTGPIGASILLCKTIGSFFVGHKLYDRIVEQQFYKVMVDNRIQLQHDSLAIFCSTVGALPLGFKLFPLVLNSTDCFQFTSITTHPRTLLKKFLRILFDHRPNKNTGKIAMCCKNLSIELENPDMYTLDGEIFETKGKKTEVSLGPEVEFVII